MALKGTPRSPNAGRKAGTPNKKTQDLFEICEKHNVNVFEAMVIECVESKEKFPEKYYANLEGLAKYLYAKRKEVDMKVDVEPIEVILRDYTSKK
jgi:hypothetical protein